MAEPRINWRSSGLGDLDALTVHQVYRLRQTVFVLEQQCLYPDIDDHDEHCLHLLGFNDQQKLVAYLRVLAPGAVYPEPAIGRVLVDDSMRGQGAGRLLIEQGIKLVHQQYNKVNIRISAQTYLLSLYQSAGFETVGEPYMEDGIPHQEMLLRVA